MATDIYIDVVWYFKGKVMRCCVLLMLYFGCSNGILKTTYYKPCEVRLRTDAGWLCGRVRLAEGTHRYASFRGVPYGKAPLGERRFKELEPLDPWTNYVDATEEGPGCPTKDIFYGRMMLQKKGMSEDCIHLNLHVPFDYFPKVPIATNGTGRQHTSLLPILVMIHGGAFQIGSGLTDLHGPEYFMTKDVIVVTFNYRLHVFGFLSLGSAQVPGNQGLRDMVTLLRWVRRNARAFGGDPDNVTLMGQSVGGIAAHILSMSRAAQGLFSKVIFMSGTALPYYYSASPQNAKKLAGEYLTLLGINSTDPQDVHRQLVKLPLLNIMEAFTVFQHKFGNKGFSPVIEEPYPGVTMILEEDPLELITQGKGSEYPLLLGITNKEYEAFRWLYINADLVDRIQKNPKSIIPARLKDVLTEDQQETVAGKIFDKYFQAEPDLDELIKCTSNISVIYGSFKQAEWRGIVGAPAYMYQFSYDSERSVLREALWETYEGAAHVEDLTYVFRVNSMLGEHRSKQLHTNDDRMKEWMITFFTNFMRCSNPTCDRRESNWPRLSEERLVYQNIERPMVYDVMELTEQQQDDIVFFDSLDEDVRQVKHIYKKNRVDKWQTSLENDEMGNDSRPRKKVSIFVRNFLSLTIHIS